MQTSMIAFNRILCPVDFSEPSTRAFAHAAALARWHDAQLTVLHVDPTFDPVHVPAELGVPVQILNPITLKNPYAQAAMTTVCSAAPFHAPAKPLTGHR
jgi:nucleotide-binding universal stress UspA family protein